MQITLDIDHLIDAEELLAKRVAKLEQENFELKEELSMAKEVAAEVISMLNPLGEVYDEDPID